MNAPLSNAPTQERELLDLALRLRNIAYALRAGQVDAQLAAEWLDAHARRIERQS
jgi:hypothetical protein